MIDDVNAATTSYTDRGLWERTTYRYSMQMITADGTQVATLDATVVTPARAGFQRLYAPTAFVNQRVPTSASLDPDSAAMASRSISWYSASANLSNNDDWGVPIVDADAATRLQSITCEYYGCDTPFPAFPIPAGAKPSTGSDHHLTVIDSSGNEADMWVAWKEGGAWHAGSRSLTKADGPALNCAVGQRCGGADAASFALAAGIVRPEEIAQGHIDHALLMTTPYTRAGMHACPAANGDGRQNDPAALPIGAHVQLDPSVDVDSLPIPAWKKVIARALQTYGAYIGDTGGSLSVRAESDLGRGYDAWAKAGVSSGSPGLSDLPWNRMRVLSITPC